MNSLPVLLMSLLVISGCAAPYPMGLSKEQWDALPPAQQAEYQAQQYAIDEQRRQKMEARREALAQEEKARMQAERERLQRLYTQGIYGDVVRVTVQGGYMQIYEDLCPYQPVAFEIAKGELKYVPFTRSGRIRQQINVRVRLSEDGNTLFFHDDSKELFTMVNTGWEAGQTYNLPRQGRYGHHTISDATITVKLKEMAGAPQRIIIENR